MFDVRYRFYERLAYLKWMLQWGAMWRDVMNVYYADQVRGKI